MYASLSLIIYSCFRVFSLDCTLHTAITDVLENSTKLSQLLVNRAFTVHNTITRMLGSEKGGGSLIPA